MVQDRCKENDKSTKKDSMRTFPFIEFVDLRNYDIKKSKISVANIQIGTPSRFFTETKPPKLTQEAENEQKEKIYRLLTEAI